MRIGILSDTHSRYATVEKALQLLQDGPDAVRRDRHGQFARLIVDVGGPVK